MTVIDTANQALAHPLRERWLASQTGLIARVRQHLLNCGANPARSLVLLPYAQLLPIARQMWAQAVPDGFVPHFETSQTLLRRRAWTSVQPMGLRFEPGYDLLSARQLLDQAGLGRLGSTLVGDLLQCAQDLAQAYAAVAPPARAEWEAKARATLEQGLATPWLNLEQATARIALEWILASSYASDGLAELLQPWDAVVVLQGYQADSALQSALANLRVVPLVLPLVSDPTGVGPGLVALHPCLDPEDEAQRAAACVLKHLAQGHMPVALVATDRVLTRRVRAMLDQQGVPLRDETGWKLSTTRAAAQLMALLRVCRWDSSSDHVLDWLKNVPGCDPAAVSALERLLRRQGWGRWQAVQDRLDGLLPPGDSQAEPVRALLGRVAGLRQAMSKPRTVSQWRQATHEALRDWGQHAALAADAAGQRVLQALGLEPQPESGQSEPAHQLRQSLNDFTTWVDAVLESTSYVPQASAAAQVVILPVAQLLARPFAALVWPGCDEVHLNPAPELPGAWTPDQRRLLGLPSREEVSQANRASWQEALFTPYCDVLWRQQDEFGEPVLPSPWALSLGLQVNVTQGADPRVPQAVAPQPELPPRADGSSLPLTSVSASAYEDLRRCPYRFFALRLLGLQDAEELSAELDKRDFGLWLHDLLKNFHEQVARDGVTDSTQRRLLLDAAARAALQQAQLDPAEFLPFEAEWPALRDAYQRWLQTHEQQGIQFVAAETRQRQGLGELTLVGTIDRIDKLPDGSIYVLDYKTESKELTRARIKNPQEDSQLAFYAALLPDDSLRAAYVNVDLEQTKTYEQTDVVRARDALIESLRHDHERIRRGAPLRALGDGAACDFCAARGLCRKDFWITSALDAELP